MVSSRNFLDIKTNLHILKTKISLSKQKIFKPLRTRLAMTDIIGISAIGADSIPKLGVYPHQVRCERVKRKQYDQERIR